MIIAQVTCPDGSTSLVNRAADRLIFLDVPDDRIRAAADGILEKQTTKWQSAAWRRGLRVGPGSGSAADVELWFRAQIATLQTGSYRFPGVSTAAAGLALALRREGALLLNVGMFRQKSQPILAGTRATKIATWPLDQFTEFEGQLLSSVDAANVKGALPAFLGAMSPIASPESFSLKALLALVDALTSSFEEAGSQEPHIIRMMVRDICTFLSIPNLAAEADALMRANGWGGHKTTYWRGAESKPHAQSWIVYFDKFVPTRNVKGSNTTRDGLLPLLRWMEESDRCVTPQEVSRAWLAEGPQNLFEWLGGKYAPSSGMPNRITSEANRFFQWLEGELPGHANPFRQGDQIRGPAHPGRTTKALIPSQVIRTAQQICEELALAAYEPEMKLSARMMERFGYLRVTHHGSSGDVNRSYSPVRPTLLLTLLMIPIRSIQARLLDSGEADQDVICFDDLKLGAPLNAHWEANPSGFAVRGRREGVFRRIRDTSAELAGRPSDFLGFWINTNKTAFNRSDVWLDRGYEIPWQREDLIYYLAKLRDWQCAYNPIQQLHSRDDLGDPDLRVPAQWKNKLPKYAYLFRDKVDGLAGGFAPPTHSVLRGFFNRVLAEAEDRFADARLLAANGERLQLVETDEYGSPTGSAYSLHGLRVAGISAFAEAGVPTPVIAEFVAGHATVLMTLYYQKFGPATVTRLLNEAIDSEAAKAHEQWLESLPRTREASPSQLYAGDVSAASQFPSGVRGLWSIKLDGACPNGQQRCHEGYPAGKNTYGAVPGGSQNCPLCRFWVTGPTFLAGQVIATNNLLFSIRKRSEALVELHRQRRTGARGYKVAHAIEALENQIDTDVRALNARHRLLQSSFELRGAVGDGEALITRSSAEALKEDFAFADVADADFYDFLAQSIEFFPELGADDAVYRRNLLIDQTLDRDGFGALLYKLPRDEALAAGNRFTRFLVEAHGRTAVGDLVDGRIRLGRDVTPRLLSCFRLDASSSEDLIVE